MGVVANLFDRAGNPVRGLPDPSGGTFDAAGDFDRLVGLPDGTSFSRIDPYSDTSFTAAELSDLLAAISHQLTYDLTGAERRGLLRLEAMATAAQRSGGSVKILGD
jgi:hypothetical protein